MMMMMMMTELSPEVHAELVGRLTALRQLAEDLAEAFDDPAAATGARQMLESLDRMLELVGTRNAPE
jgi:hypothetical protein